MSGVVFVTVEDLSKAAGGGVATQETAIAIGRVATGPVVVLAPEPAGDLPQRLTREVDQFRFLPPETAPGNPRWHAKIELSTLWNLWAVLRTRDPSVVVTRLSPSTLFPAPLCRAFGVPHVLLIRGWVNRDDEYDRTKFHDFVEQIVRMNVRLSESVFVAFEALRDWLTGYRDRAQSPIRVLPNAVDPEVFAPVPKTVARSELGLELEEEAFLIGFIGSMADRHRVEELLHAVARMDDVHALLVGDGARRPDLERLADELGVRPHVTFTGRVPHEAVPRYVAACDVTYGVVDPIEPSNPIKIYESLACERPVITSRSPELAFVEEINSGVVVEEIDVDHIARALSELRATAPASLSRMGERGREHVVENHTWTAMAVEILSAP
jgi:glycosyltransferase involved in cell wall biosynthesis